MSTRNISKIFFIIVALFLFSSCSNRENPLSFQEFFNKIEKKLPEIEAINFRSYTDFSNTLCMDTISARRYFNVFEMKYIWNDWVKERNYYQSELPKEFIENFSKLKKICNELSINEISKNKENSLIELSFDIESLKTETIPNWDMKNDSKKSNYGGYLVYDLENKYANDSTHYKIKDNWYIWFFRYRT